MGTWYCNGNVYDNEHGEDIFKTSGDYIIKYVDDNGCETTRTYKVTCGTPPQPTECTCTSAQIGSLQPFMPSQPAAGWTQPYSAATFTANTTACADVTDFRAVPVVDGEDDFLGDNPSVVKTPGVSNGFHIVATMLPNTSTSSRSQKIAIFIGYDKCDEVIITQGGTTPLGCDCTNAHMSQITTIRQQAAGSGPSTTSKIAEFTASCLNASDFIAVAQPVQGGDSFLTIVDNGVYKDNEVQNGFYVAAIVAQNLREERSQTINVYVGSTSEEVCGMANITQSTAEVPICNDEDITRFGSGCNSDGKSCPTISFSITRMRNVCGYEADDEVQYTVIKKSDGSVASTGSFNITSTGLWETINMSPRYTPGIEVIISWSVYTGEPGNKHKTGEGKNEKTIPEWRTDYIKVNEYTSKLFCDGTYNIVADLMDGTASTETVKEHLTQAQIAQMIYIDPEIDTSLEPRQHTITLDNQDVCPVSWNYTTECNTYTVTTDWTETPSQEIWQYSLNPQYVTTSVSSNVTIDKDGTNITSQCSEIEFDLYAFTLSGTFVKCDSSQYSDIFENGEHIINCPSCSKTVNCATDTTLNGLKAIGNYTTQVHFDREESCGYWWSMPVSGTYFYIKGVKFKYGGRYIYVAFTSKSNTGSTIA